MYSLNIDIDSLINKIDQLHYPVKVSDYQPFINKKRLETQKIQQQFKHAPVGKFKHFEEEEWFKNQREMICNYICEGKLAPYTEMDEEDMETEITCCLCFTPIKNKMAGYNRICCTGIVDSHLICTGCLLDSFSQEIAQNKPEDQRTIDLKNLKMFCNMCKQTSSLEFYPPTDEELIKEANDDEVSSKIVYLRRGCQSFMF